MCNVRGKYSAYHLQNFDLLHHSERLSRPVSCGKSTWIQTTYAMTSYALALEGCIRTGQKMGIAQSRKNKHSVHAILTV